MMVKSHTIDIAFKYLVTFEGEGHLPEQDLLFRLGYDPAEIPVSDDLFNRVKNELLEVLPTRTKIDRVGGELSLNGAKVKKF